METPKTHVGGVKPYMVQSAGGLDEEAGLLPQDTLGQRKADGETTGISSDLDMVDLLSGDDFNLGCTMEVSSMLNGICDATDDSREIGGHPHDSVVLQAQQELQEEQQQEGEATAELAPPCYIQVELNLFNLLTSKVEDSERLKGEILLAQQSHEAELETVKKNKQDNIYKLKRKLETMKKKKNAAQVHLRKAKEEIKHLRLDVEKKEYEQTVLELTRESMEEQNSKIGVLEAQVKTSKEHLEHVQKSLHGLARANTLAREKCEQMLNAVNTNWEGVANSLRTDITKLEAEVIQLKGMRHPGNQRKGPKSKSSPNTPSNQTGNTEKDKATRKRTPSTGGRGGSAQGNQGSSEQNGVTSPGVKRPKKQLLIETSELLDVSPEPSPESPHK